MKYRRLGSSELEVSVLSMGCWQLASGDYWGPTEHPDEAVQAALDAGINTFDVAESYERGESERVLGKALGRRRDEAIVATKISPKHCAPDQVRSTCEDSLRRLNTDRIDLYQVHWPPREVAFDDVAEALLKLKSEGKIREIGVSNFGVLDLADWPEDGQLVSNQLGYNLLFRAIEYDIVPACRERNIGILVYMPVLQGLLAGRWHSVDEIPGSRRRTRHFAQCDDGPRHGEAGHEALTFRVLAELEAEARGMGQPMATVAIAWAIAQPQVAGAIVGCRKKTQVERNVAAAELELSPEQIARLNAVTDPLKAALGRNADMWLGERESRIR